MSSASSSQPSNTQPANPVAGFGTNEWLVEEMYQQYLADPRSVDQAWHEFFADYRPGSPVADGQDRTSAPAPAAEPAAPTPAAEPAATSSASSAPAREAAPQPAPSLGRWSGAGCWAAGAGCRSADAGAGAADSGSAA